MNKLHFLYALPFVLAACDSASDRAPAAATETVPEPPAIERADAVAGLEVSNPSAFARPDTLIGFSLNELGVTAGPLQVWEGDTALPTQLLDDDGDQEPDRMMFLTSLDAAATQQYVIDRHVAELDVAPRTHAEVSIKEGGEWQGKVYAGGTFKNVDHVTTPPQYTDHSEYIRYEGPGIESDRVGYRIYLDWRNGFDIFGKKTSDMVLPQVGLDGYDSYHEMSDWGADILKVGNSLGMGGLGYWDGSKAVLVSEVSERSTTIRSDGPIHASFDIDYQGWNTGAAVVDMKATLSMQAGSPMVDVKLETSTPLDNLAIGIVAHPGTELLMGDLDITGEAWSYMASFGPQSLFEDNLGMVVLFRKMDLAQQTRDENSYVLVMKPRGTELSYAFGALWSGQQGGVQTRADLEAFLAAEIERRTLAPRLRLKTEAFQKLSKLSPIDISIGLADSEMKRRGESLSYGGWDALNKANSRWSYTTGLLMQSMDDLSAATGNPAYADYARRTIDSYLGEDGAIHTYQPEAFNIDQINSGKMLQRLYARDSNPKYRAAIDALAAQLAEHPRTSEGAFWHKQRYPWQLWLDGVYMGMPFLAGVGVMEADDHKLEEAAREFSIARSHLRDAETGLYYHAWDEAREQPWADPETGRSPYVWARGLGWYAMALVDILDVIPADQTELRAPLLDIIPELADSLIRTQDATGAWFQILDMPGAAGNYREASGSAMFTYFLAKAINKGYLPERYADAAVKAYAGLVNEFFSVYADGSFHVRNICQVAGLGHGRDGSYRYYMSEPVVEDDPKGLAPAIMAGIQILEFTN
jgi:unsaturated rhamnogalacturonyl hydrolase